MTTTAIGATVDFLGAYQEVLEGILEEVFHLAQVSKVYCSKDLELVPNLATRVCGGTVVYQSVDQGILEGIFGGLFFIPCLQSVWFKRYS